MLPGSEAVCDAGPDIGDMTCTCGTDSSLASVCRSVTLSWRWTMPWTTRPARTRAAIAADHLSRIRLGATTSRFTTFIDETPWLFCRCDASSRTRRERRAKWRTSQREVHLRLLVRAVRFAYCSWTLGASR